MIKKLSLAVVLSLTAVQVHAGKSKPSETSIPTPSPIGVIYYLKSSSLMDLERTSYSSETKGAGKAVLTNIFTAGIWSSKIKEMIVVPGSSSSVEIQEVRPKFVMRFTPGFDVKKIELVALESKKKQREIVNVEAGGVAAVSDVKQGYTAVSIDIFPHPTDSQVILFSPISDLMSGEYAISDGASKELFCFRIKRNDDEQAKKLPSETK